MRQQRTTTAGAAFRWIWVLIVAAVAVLFGVRLRRRRARARELAAVKEAAREDLVALADDVAELEDDVERNPEAKDDYLLALEQYASPRSASTARARPNSSSRWPRRSTRAAT